MKKIFALLISGIAFFATSPKTEKIVGVIVPMEHQALKEIVAGLQEGLKSYPGVSLRVMNAQGDMNLQRSIIEKLMRDRCDVLVPIGTAASQMTINLAKTHKIVCLATHLMPSQEGVQTTCLNDELSSENSLEFLKAVFPRIKKVTLIYSASEKVAQEIPRVTEAATARKIALQKLMVQTLADLYTVGHAIDPDSEAVFILKDHLVVSGIQALAQQAEKRKIPVITSDEGSIIRGGAFAIGVKEAEIGRQGAQMIKKVLEGVSPQNIAPQSLKGPFPLFVNRKACIKQGVDVSALAQKASKLGYVIEYTDQESK